MTSTPSRVARRPASRRRRAATSAGRPAAPRTSKRSCTAVSTLLTFWPPGPDARRKLTSSSRSSIFTPGATVITLLALHSRTRLRPYRRHLPAAGTIDESLGKLHPAPKGAAQLPEQGGEAD